MDLLSVKLPTGIGLRKVRSCQAGKFLSGVYGIGMSGKLPQKILEEMVKRRAMCLGINPGLIDDALVGG